MRLDGAAQKCVACLYGAAVGTDGIDDNIGPAATAPLVNVNKPLTGYLRFTPDIRH